MDQMRDDEFEEAGQVNVSCCLERENKEFSLHWPGKVVFGAGKLEALSDEAKPLGQRIFLVTTSDLTSLGFTKRAQMILESANLLAETFDNAQPNPTCQQVDEVSWLVTNAQADCVVAIGGGSAIDLAKAVAVGATHEGSIWDYMTYTGAHAQPICPDAVLPIIAVPTTAGTGSEVTQGAIIDNPQLGMKAPLLNPLIIPRLALIDPELTYTMPPMITALTALDAMTHGIEAFLNVERHNCASDMFALTAVRLVAQNLPLALTDPDDHSARQRLCWAAYAGGMSIALANAGVSHAMAMPAGARLHLPHGLLLSRIQPVVLEQTWQAQPSRCAALADAVNPPATGTSPTQSAKALSSWLTGFIEQIGLADAWTTPPPDGATLDTLTRDVFGYMTRPIKQYRPVFTPSHIRDMFEQSFSTNLRT